MMKYIFSTLIFLFTLQSCQKEKIEDLRVYRECDQTYLISYNDENVYLICNSEKLDAYADGDIVNVQVKPTKYDCKYAQLTCSIVYYPVSEPVSIIRFNE